MSKVTMGLLAAVVIALASAPAEAATKKGKSGKKAKKDKAEVAKVENQGVHPMGFTCTLNAIFGAKQPKACGG